MFLNKLQFVHILSPPATSPTHSALTFTFQIHALFLCEEKKKNFKTTVDKSTVKQKNQQTKKCL